MPRRPMTTSPASFSTTTMVTTLGSRQSTNPQRVHVSRSRPSIVRTVRPIPQLTQKCGTLSMVGRGWCGRSIPLIPRYTRSFGLRRASLELQHFEELPLGSEWTTRRRTIGQAEVAAFLGLSGDLNPLYADVEYARGGPFGEVVVPGTLIAALAIGLGTIDGPVPATVGLVGMTWRFQRPVHVGDTIRCRWRLHRKRDVENPHWGLAVWQVEVENQHGEVVATAELARLVSRRQVPTETRSGKKRRRRGLETGAPALPPK